MSKTLLITGCSTGIGRALAVKFAAENYDVLAVARTGDLLQGLSKSSRNIYFITADITLEKDREKIYDIVKEKNTSVSIIHNAGIATPCQFASIDEALWLQHIQTNFLAPLLITQQLLPCLQGERILHVTSGAASLPIAGLLPYCATKAAMQQAIRCLNKELLSRQIFCANLRPGMVDTNLLVNFRKSNVQTLPNKDFYTNLAEEKKLIPPSLVAEFVAWVLLKTDSKLFSETEWNIYDEFYQSYWLTDNQRIPII